MKTKEFIAMLQKEDPSGEGNLRLPDGIPYYVEAKEGYWDGPYTFLDENGNFVTSTREYKVDVYCMNSEDFIERNLDIHNPNNWEEIKNKLIFDFCGIHPSLLQGKIDERLNSAKKFYDEMYGYEKESFEKWIEIIKERVDKGNQYFQKKDTNTITDWFIIDENGQPEKNGTNWGTMQVFLYSNLFEKVDNGIKEGFYQWKYKN